MYIFFENLLTPAQCDELNQVALQQMFAKKMHYEADNGHYANSYGTARLPIYEKLLYELTPKIKEATKMNNIKEENSYTRIYYNGAKLKTHKDREGLDLTLSICTYTNLGFDWPLHVEIEPGIVKSFVTKPGDGALILGTAMNHWRDDLHCEEHQMVIQSFYHWRILNVTKIF